MKADLIFVDGYNYTKMVYLSAGSHPFKLWPPDSDLIDWELNQRPNRVTTGLGKSWNLGRPFFMLGKSCKTAKVI